MSSRDLSVLNTLYITGQSTFSSVIENAPEEFFESLNEYRRVFSSDDVSFEKGIVAYFPFLPDVNEVTTVSFEIQQRNFSKEVIEEVTASNIGTYASTSGTISYLFFNLTIPAELTSEVCVTSKLNFSNSKPRTFRRIFNFIPKIGSKLTSIDNLVTSEENTDDIKGDLIISHPTSFKVGKYHIAPFALENVEEELTNTITLNQKPDRIENTNPNRTNAYFDFNPDILPRPILQERKIGSTELDVESFIKTLPGLNYTQIDFSEFGGGVEDVSDVPKFFNVVKTGNWEFWNLFPDVRYSAKTPGSTAPIPVIDIRPLIIAKNNSRFTDSVVIYDVGGLSSYRLPWQQGDTDTDPLTGNFWRALLDNTEDPNGIEFFRKAVFTYFLDGENPYIPSSTGFVTNFSFRHIVDPLKPTEFIELILSLSVSGDEFFDVILDVRNNTSEDVRSVGFFQTFNTLNARNFSAYWPGKPDVDSQFRFYGSYKFNDPTNADPTKRSDWVPEDKASVQSGLKPSDVYGLDEGNFFIASKLEPKREEIEIKPNALINGSFESTITPWIPSENAITSIETLPEVVFSGSSSLGFSHPVDDDGFVTQSFVLTDRLLDKRLWFSYYVKASSSISSIIFDGDGVDDLSAISETPDDGMDYVITITADNNFTYQAYGFDLSSDIPISDSFTELGNTNVFVKFDSVVEEDHVVGDFWQFSTIPNTETVSTKFGYSSDGTFIELDPTSGDLEVEYNNSDWEQVTGYFDIDTITGTIDDNQIFFTIRPTETTSSEKSFVDRAEVRIIEKDFETPPDPTRDFKFLDSENDPRWFQGDITSFGNGTRTALVTPSSEFPDTDWFYLDPDSLSDFFFNESRVEPFFVLEFRTPNFTSTSGVLAVVAEDCYYSFFSTTEIGDPSATSNEYLNRYSPLSGPELVRARTTETTRTRVFFDNQNGTREAWYTNVFLNLDFDNVTYGATSSTGVSESFSNNMDIALESYINDRTSLEQNKIFKLKYKYISPDDALFAIDSNEGVAVSGKISLRDSEFGLNIIQKTNFLYEKTSDRDLRIRENVSVLDIAIGFSSLPAIGTTIIQENTAARALVLDAFAMEDGSGRLIIDKIRRVFNDTDTINGTNINNEAIALTPDGVPFKLTEFDHTFVKLVTTDTGSDLSEDPFVQSFDRPLEVLREDGSVGRLQLKSLSDNIFEGGNFTYPTGDTLGSIKILGN